jgi:hypothetical protein
MLVMTLLVLFGYSCKHAFGNIYDLMNFESSIVCVVPLVILNNGTNNTSTIYANSTSAKVSVNTNATSLTYSYSLNIVNNNASLWEVRLEHFNYTNINFANATIILHDNVTSSQQITLSGGNISQTNQYYNLTSNSTIHIGIQNLVENSSGTTLLHVYLKIKAPDTTTYTLYIITFEFT